MLTHRPHDRLSLLRTAIFVGMVSLPLGVALGQPPAVASAGVLQGRVKSDTGNPLPGVRIRVAIPATDMRFIDASKNHTVLEATTDASGDYRLEIPGLANRTKVSIDAMMAGFERLSGTLMAGGDARTVEVAPGGPAVVANLALKPARYFAGVVVDEQGQPIPGVEITVSLASKNSTAYVEVTATKQDGTFEIFGYPMNPTAFGGQDTKGIIAFTHPNYSEFVVKDVEAIESDRQRELWIVLPTGFKLTGTVVDADGKPVPKAMIEATLISGTRRKATVTDANGKFSLSGLTGGSSTINAGALPIKQRARISLVLEGDKEGLEVRLQPMVLPADLKRYNLLGMQLADVTPELKAIYDLHQARGVVIVDPGQDSDRLNIGELAEGYTFWLVGSKRITGVREFVDQLLAETGGLVADEYSIRVVYNLKTTEMTGSSTQHLKITKDDLKQLQALADQFKNEPK